ncbi:hypothetical protein NHX12_013106 [Muraenolepis orangiensis]|uniref:RING-type domain-containing protein n=1 Tax=Muraenolepis orangiensis TaxID=630683 RepID=A0A9Q0DHH5_9TELE|nr:hypothetical protein NHX12_013106 [Muraenolepis orangiensis]
MEQQVQVWNTQVEVEDADRDGRSSVCSQPECSICYNTYDNVFKTPKLLDCTHTFCLECLSRLMASTSVDDQEQPAAEGAAASPGASRLSCPFCRRHTTLPELGPPALATSREVLCKLPSHQQREEPVWLDGQKLCYKSTDPDAGSAGSAGSPFCICINIGADKGTEAAPRARSQSPGMFERLTDWKRLLVFVVLMVILVVVVLWPLQCILTTGNMRCMTSKPGIVTNITTATTTTATTTTTAAATAAAATTTTAAATAAGPFN